MRSKYRFLNPKTGVVSIHEMTEAEFRHRVKKGKMLVENRLFGGMTKLKLISSSPQQRTTSVGATWPMKADGVAVHTSQVGDAIAEDIRLGVPTDYCPDTGAPIFTSALHRKRWGEAHGFYVATEKGSSSSMDPVRLDSREREIRALAGRAVRKCDDQEVLIG